MRALVLILLITVTQSCLQNDHSGSDRSLQQSVDFPGGDIEKIPTPDVLSCQILCTNHPQCNYFSCYSIDPSTGDRSFDCYLKMSDTETPVSMVPLPGVTSGFSLPKTLEYVNRCLAHSYEDMEFVDNVLSSGLVHSCGECEASCTRNPGCQFYTCYPHNPADPVSQKRCYLQYSSSLPSPQTITVTPGAQSGLSQRDCCTGSQCMNGCADFIFPDTVFAGTAIADVTAVDPQACQLQCTQNPLCQFFSFSLQKSLWQKCYLYRSESGLPDNVASEVNMFSGFSKQATEPDYVYAGVPVLDVEVQNLGQCQELCTDHALCQFFTFLPGRPNTANGMTICHLKKAPENIPTKMTYLENAVSGFSMQYNTVLKTLQNCSDLLYPDLEFSGVDVAQVEAVDAESCRESCTLHPDCKYFTFSWSDAEDSFICNLRTSLLGGVDDIFPAQSATSGFSLQAESYMDCSTLLLPDTTFSGALIGYKMAANVHQCQRLCTQNPACQFFTYLGVDWTLDERRFYCFLQRSSQGVPDTIIHVHNSMSGFTKPLSGLHFECVTDVYDNVNFPGSDERSLNTASYEECQNICTEDPLCQFFTFFNQTEILPDQRDTCYLKSMLSVPLPHTIKYSSKVVSGFPHRSCKGQYSDFPSDVPRSC